MNSSGIVCNVRSLAHDISGVQRYTRELLDRFGTGVEEIAPEKPRLGASGHAWEQFVLPSRLAGRLLWSPSNTGPMSVERQVVTLADVSPIDHPEWMSRKFSLWYRFMIPRLVSKVRMVLTVSHYSKARILAICPEAKDKVHVVHLAADQRFRPVHDDGIAHMRHRLGLPQGRYVLALGSLEPRKNLPRLLRAWATIAARLPDDVWLILAGAKGKSMIFADQSFEPLPPRVHLTGHVPDEMLPALYTGAIASAYVSLYEGFGLPPLESMACATPVIASNAASLPEVVGDAAWSVDPFDVDAIAYGLEELINNSSRRDALSARGVARAKMFDWDKTAAQTLSLLQMAAHA